MLYIVLRIIDFKPKLGAILSGAAAIPDNDVFNYADNATLNASNYPVHPSR